MTGSLTDDQVAGYRRDGFLLPVTVASGSQAAAWRAGIEAFEDRWRDDPALPRPFVEYTRANLHVVSAAAARIALEPSILDAVESVIGVDVLCWMVELIVKEPHTSKVLTIHQDMAYWGLEGTDGLVTAWVALSDATADNGAMIFVRGSHRGGAVGHHDTFASDNLLSRGQEVDVEHDPADEVVAELQAGEMSLHHGLMFHGSGPNRTGERRIGLVIRYVSPDVAQTVGPTDYAMVARGVNRSSRLQSVAPPVEDFRPEALTLHAEITAAQAAALGAGATDDPSYAR